MCTQYHMRCTRLHIHTHTHEGGWLCGRLRLSSTRHGFAIQTPLRSYNTYKSRKQEPPRARARNGRMGEEKLAAAAQTERGSRLGRGSTCAVCTYKCTRLNLYKGERERDREGANALVRRKFWCFLDWVSKNNEIIVFESSGPPLINAAVRGSKQHNRDEILAEEETVHFLLISIRCGWILYSLHHTGTWRSSKGHFVSHLVHICKTFRSLYSVRHDVKYSYRLFLSAINEYLWNIYNDGMYGHKRRLRNHI